LRAAAVACPAAQAVDEGGCRDGAAGADEAEEVIELAKTSVRSSIRCAARSASSSSAFDIAAGALQPPQQ